MRLDERVSVNDGRDSIRRVVKAIDELETERNQKSDAEQNVRENAGLVDRRKIDGEARYDVDQAAHEHESKYAKSPFCRRVVL
jgi:hypothetical protein